MQSIMSTTVSYERDQCSDNISTRRTSRVTPSHPGCPRRRCRRSTNPYQSPIRITIWERSSTGIHSSPWYLAAPDNSLVTKHIHAMQFRISVYLTEPFHSRFIAKETQSFTSLATAKSERKLGLIIITHSCPNPLTSLLLDLLPSVMPAIAKPVKRYMIGDDQATCWTCPTSLGAWIGTGHAGVSPLVTSCWTCPTTSQPDLCGSRVGSTRMGG